MFGPGIVYFTDPTYNRQGVSHLLTLGEVMEQFSVAGISALVSMLEMVRSDAKSVAESGRQSYENKDQKETLATLLCTGGIMLAEVQADASLIDQMKSLQEHLQSSPECHVVAIATALQQIIIGIQAFLKQHLFMYIPACDAAYWNEFQSYGTKFIATFPVDAVVEVIEANNCFVCSRYTASVFHSMRVAEYGLRSLGRLVGVKLKDKYKVIPIEYATWGKVIQEIKAKIAEARQLPVGSKKEKKLQFYSSAADQCEYMKDIWRNQLAHTRPRSYKREEALGVINRVKEFVQVLAEHECTPKKQQAMISRKYRELQLLLENEAISNKRNPCP